MTRIFVALDIETTGLDPLNDYILEIAWQILDENFEPLTEVQDFIVDHGDSWGDMFFRLRGAPAVVREMHARSGLTGDLAAQPSMSMSDIAKSLKSDLRAALSTKPVGTTIHLLGRSVDFDRNFLLQSRAFTEEADLFEGKGYASFHHSVIDLSSFRLMLESLGHQLPETEAKTTHRAGDDVAEATELAQKLRKMIGAAL